MKHPPISMATPKRNTPRKVLPASVASSSSLPCIQLQWEPIVPLGPKTVFHVGGIIRGAIFIHGGVREVGSTQPSNQLYRLDLCSTMWVEIRTPNSPSLSHHTAIVVEDRYLLLIGGWDGKRRTSDIYIYDVQEDVWQKAQQNGFPEGAGLSSHTACQLITGDIIVVGREGSLRTQRKHGNVFILSGNILSGRFTYKEISHEVTSRSGHTANIIGSEIFMIGGRSDKLLEKAQGFKGTAQKQCNILTQILSTIESQKQLPMLKLPCGRKNHIAAADDHCILVHGGETFDGKSREPVGDMFLASLKSPTNIFKLNTTTISRAGHVCFVLPDKILIHGGYSGKSLVHSDLCQLKTIAS